MKRRGLLVALALAPLGAPLASLAQQPMKVYRIGFLGTTSASGHKNELAGFRSGLRDLGYVEGKNVLIEFRWADGNVGRLPALAGELVRLKVDVIMTGGPGVEAAKNATKTIPIVIADVADPVASGLVASLARPGGNITGLSALAAQLSGKRLELLKEVIPNLSRVAFLFDPTNPSNALILEETKIAAAHLRMALQPLEVRSPADLEAAFSALSKGGGGALVVLRNPVNNTHRGRILDFAAEKRLPAIYVDAEYTELGGLMSYGPNRPEMWRRGATYVDKILKGAKPGDLPIEQPTKFELVVNLKTAKAIGITIPQSVLVRTDRVIE